MSTYGDRGNIIVLQKRLEWRGIHVEIKKIFVDETIANWGQCDLFFMGGAQDLQQEIVVKDLLGQRADILIKRMDEGVPGLFICGAYQFLGKYYKTADGTILKGLGFYDLYTESSKIGEPRLIGNLIVDVLPTNQLPITNNYLIGFENHGGRTYLGNTNNALATVMKGYGNNGRDKTEGILFKNTIGTYLHGPILPKNPQIADWLLSKALEQKYKKVVDLERLPGTIELKARKIIMNKTK